MRKRFQNTSVTLKSTGLTTAPWQVHRGPWLHISPSDWEALTGWGVHHWPSSPLTLEKSRSSWGLPAGLDSHPLTWHGQTAIPKQALGPSRNCLLLYIHSAGVVLFTARQISISLVTLLPIKLMFAHKASLHDLTMEHFELIICRHFITYSRRLDEIAATFYSCANEDGSCYWSSLSEAHPPLKVQYIYFHMCFLKSSWFSTHVFAV